MNEVERKVQFFKKVQYFRGPGELYLTRYIIAKTKWFSLYVHQFHASDYPTFHDHPWAFFAMPIKIGYREHFIDGTFVDRKPFRPGVRGSRTFHWVELLPGTEGKVWTIFATGPRHREWGFMTEKGWIEADMYAKLRGIFG